MNILLVYPEFPDTFWSFKHALSFVRKKSSFPPLGLLTVAAMLPEDWKRRLVDLNVSRLTDADLAWADYVFLSGMTVQRKSAHEVVARCKTAGVKTVAGGPLFVIDHEQFEDVDHFVLDEAELTMPLFLADLAKGRPQPIYRAPEFADIEETPVPQWDLVDLRQYASMCIQYSRGCPYNCDFCNVTTLFGHRPRVKTPEQIIAELEAIYQTGWRGHVFFVDDNLIGNKREFKTKLLPALIEWQKNRRIPFYTEVSINLSDDQEMMDMMFEAGFLSVFIGIETVDEDSLAECSKNQNKNRDMVENVKRIQRAGMQVQGGFIVGFDSDKPSIFQKQIDFIQNSGIVTAMVGLLQAPPGTQLYERMKNEGRLLDQCTGDNVDGTTNIIPIMNFDTLREGYQSILDHIYAPAPYYRRVKTFLREYKAPKINTLPDIQYILAFPRSILRLGILGKERAHYWNLLLWTLFRRPTLFPLAVTLAIYGHHFRKVCQLHVV
jgi:radical SAM superfamily enzyme YgiQ (UPF0313 family)